MGKKTSLQCSSRFDSAVVYNDWNFFETRIILVTDSVSLYSMFISGSGNPYPVSQKICARTDPASFYSDLGPFVTFCPFVTLCTQASTTGHVRGIPIPYGMVCYIHYTECKL